MRIQDCMIDNRVFLVALDDLYRAAMKGHERDDLLSCGRQVAAALDVVPASTPVPVEGYYAEDADLAEWFHLVRALQAVDVERRVEVSALPAYQRLLAVTSAPLYGRPQHHGLLPVGRDPLAEALLETDTEQWSPRQLTAAARAVARRTDDCSLVGLAARARDPVLIAAFRESVVLYAEVVFDRVTRRCATTGIRLAGR